MRIFSLAVILIGNTATRNDVTLVAPVLANIEVRTVEQMVDFAVDTAQPADDCLYGCPDIRNESVHELFPVASVVGIDLVIHHSDEAIVHVVDIGAVVRRTAKSVTVCKILALRITESIDGKVGSVLAKFLASVTFDVVCHFRFLLLLCINDARHLDLEIASLILLCRSNFIEDAVHTASSTKL